MKMLGAIKTGGGKVRFDIEGGRWFWKWRCQAEGSGNVWRWQPSGQRCGVATEAWLLNQWLAWQAREAAIAARIKSGADDAGLPFSSGLSD